MGYDSASTFYAHKYEYGGYGDIIITIRGGREYDIQYIYILYRTIMM